MVVEIVDAYERNNKNTGELIREVRVLGEFDEFQQIKKSTVDLKVDSEEQFNILKQSIGKKLDIDVVIPKPQYSLRFIKINAIVKDKDK